MGKDLTILQGKVSDIRYASTPSGSADNVSGFINTSHHTYFRINNKPAIYNGSPHLKDGDVVTIVGYDYEEISAYALRNEKTGVEYFPKSFSGIFILIGYIFTIASILGLKTCAASARPGNTTVFETFITWSICGGWAFIGGLAAICFGRRNKYTHKHAIELLRRT